MECETWAAECEVHILNMIPMCRMWDLDLQCAERGIFKCEIYDVGREIREIRTTK